MNVVKRPIDNEQKNSNGGVFYFDNLPPNCFHLGGCIFVVVNSFKEEEVRIHIRKYNSYNKKCYPSKLGMTMSSTQWTEMIKNSEKMTQHLQRGVSDVEFVYNGNFKNRVQVREHQISFIKEITSKSGKVFKNTITLTEDQWNELFRISTDISNHMIDILFKDISFGELFSEWISNDEIILQDDNMKYKESLTLELQAVIGNHIRTSMNETCLLEYRDPFEVFLDVTAFNNAVLGLDLGIVAEDYAKRTLGRKMNPFDKSSPDMRSYINTAFLKTVKLNTLINNIRKEMNDMDDFC